VINQIGQSVDAVKGGKLWTSRFEFDTGWSNWAWINAISPALAR
jgi:hypothetical protein